MATTGCLHEPDLDVNGGLYEPMAYSAPEPVVRREVTMAYGATEGAATVVAPVPAASPRDRPPPDPVPFRIGAGHGALGRVDLAACREQGLPPGYLRMQVTFRRNGEVAHAAVEGPVPPPQEALDCIAEQLEDAQVPAFDGRDATLSKRFFVEPGTGTEPEDTVVHKGGAPSRRKATTGAAPITASTKP